MHFELHTQIKKYEMGFALLKTACNVVNGEQVEIFLGDDWNLMFVSSVLCIVYYLAIIRQTPTCYLF
jgi:hypothetical protein